MDESSAWRLCQDQQKARERGADDPKAAAAVAHKRRHGNWPGIHPAEKSNSGRERLLETYGGLGKELAKDSSTKTASTKFKAELRGGVQAVFKVDDRFVVWGPASVEVVDKENDKITTEALEEALPQLMRRKRMSWEHADMLVGDILEEFKTDEPVTVEYANRSVTRKSFPTEVLHSDEDDVPDDGLYVASEVYDDSRAAHEVREKIEAGEIDSYSISGEAISSKTKYESGDVYDEITKLDLSAVTYCESGMNQRSKFGQVVKLDGRDNPEAGTSAAASSPTVAVLGKTDETQEMTDSTNEKSDDELKAVFKDAAEEVIEDADFVTKSELDQRVEKLAKERNETPDANEGDEEDFPGDDEEEADNGDDEGDAPDEEEEKAGEVPDDDPDDDPDETGVDPDEIEDPDDDGEEELDLDPEEDEVTPPEEPEDADTKNEEQVLEYLDGEVPDDLYEGVKEHLDGGDEEAEDEVVGGEDDEMPGDDEPEEVMASEGEKQSKSAVSDAGPRNYVDKAAEDFLGGAGSEATLPSPNDEEVRKATDEQPDADSVEEAEGDDSVDKNDSEHPGLLGAMYKDDPNINAD